MLGVIYDRLLRQRCAIFVSRYVVSLRCLPCREEWEELSGKLGDQFEISVVVRDRDIFERAVAECPRLGGQPDGQNRVSMFSFECTASSMLVFHHCARSPSTRKKPSTRRRVTFSPRFARIALPVLAARSMPMAAMAARAKERGRMERANELCPILMEALRNVQRATNVVLSAGALGI